MAERKKLNHPWLIAVWPGMGQVAMSAGFYLMAKLEMHLLAEFSPRELFDIDHVEVKDGLIRTAGLPRSRFFVRHDPEDKRDLVVFIGEAQPPNGKYAFCSRLIEFAKEIGVEHVFTFAAMVTQMHPEHPSRVFGAATDAAGLEEMQNQQLEVLEDGQISGLNGLLLGVAGDSGLRGSCLLGEMPHVFAQLPFPRASLAVLEIFKSMANLDLDLDELVEQVREADEQLGELLERVKRAVSKAETDEDEEKEFETSGRLSREEEQEIERLFEQSRRDRSKAYELKSELDRLGVFSDYEERFLDLFKKPEI